MTGRHRKHDDDNEPHRTRRMPDQRTRKDDRTIEASLFQVKGSTQFALVTWSDQSARLFLLGRSNSDRLIVDEIKVLDVVPVGTQRTLTTTIGYMNIPACGVSGGGMLAHAPLQQVMINGFTIAYDRRGKPTTFTPKE